MPVLLFVLLIEDFRTQTWRRLEAHLRTRLASLRESNDRALDPIKTAAIRGQLATVKELLALAEQARTGTVPGPEQAPGDPQD